jgi:hypothetical protein
MPSDLAGPSWAGFRRQKKSPAGAGPVKGDTGRKTLCRPPFGAIRGTSVHCFSRKITENPIFPEYFSYEIRFLFPRNGRKVSRGQRCSGARSRGIFCGPSDRQMSKPIIRGKVVTGATSGIGRIAAERLARAPASSWSRATGCALLQPADVDVDVDVDVDLLDPRRLVVAPGRIVPGNVLVHRFQSSNHIRRLDRVWKTTCGRPGPD